MKFAFLWLSMLTCMLILFGGEPRAASGKISASEFNKKVVEAFARGEAWTQSSLLAALRFVGANCECGRRTIEIRSTPEAFSDARVTVTDAGLQDDSVRAIRHTLLLLRHPKGYWRLKHAARAWSCWKGRGHQDFSTKPCR